MNTIYCAQGEQQYISQMIDARINQVENVADSYADTFIAEIVNNDIENLNRTNDGEFNLLDYVLGNEGEQLPSDDLTDGILVEIKDEDLKSLVDDLDIEMLDKQLQQEPVSANTVYDVQNLEYAHEIANSSISCALSNLVRDIGIADEFDQTPIYNSDWAYASPSLASNSPFSAPIPSPVQYQRVEQIVSPAPSTSSLLDSRKRGRPSNDWFDPEFIKKLIDSANGDPEKLKQINNNIASGRYRYKKKANKSSPLPHSESLLRVQRENHRLRMKEQRNSDWIEKVKAMIALRAYKSNYIL